jgi:hypothetical protein
LTRIQKRNDPIDLLLAENRRCRHQWCDAVHLALHEDADRIGRQ